MRCYFLQMALQASLHRTGRWLKSCAAIKKPWMDNAWPPIFVVVNKCENNKQRSAASEFYELGLGDPYPLSAIHGTGTGDLLDALVASFPAQAAAEEDEID